MKRALEMADFVLKVLSCGALLVGGSWAYYQFNLGGAKDWVNNMSIQTEVLPYREELRLLVVHVKSKNPRITKFEFDKETGSYELRVRRVPDDLKFASVIREDEGELIGRANLLPADGYELLPNAVFDDMAAFVVKAGETVMVTADMQIANGTRNKAGKPDRDYVSASAIVRVQP
ncbi:hypothetical protein [Cupriavidus sp. PET2-C1]